MTTSTSDSVTNPYVGPRTFSYADRKRFFGRETEAASLLARVISERLLLFYAQSGAGKSSLINARLIPRLREEERFSVLPVGRVAGQLPSGVEQVDNIFLFNLMSSLDQGGSPAQWARLNLNDFLEHLVTDDGLAWRYDPAAVAGPAEEEAAPVGDAAPDARFALVIDQFEEIITGHPDRWREREDFFRQLDAALQANPNLWVVLSLREDYVAALDPYAQLLFNRLRARFYMERMGEAAGLEAIRKPAELGGRPFAAGVAEKLVDDLCQVRITGQEGTVPGQYVEPVQLQVVCYQLWENLVRGIQATEGIQITSDDLAVAGDVNLALAQFYEETLALALADPAAAGVNERRVRAWFDEELITEAGTRGLVHQGTRETGSLPNAVVGSLQKRFLVRGEARGGDTWIELVHDRFVEPIRANNAAWFPLHLSALQRQAALWDEQGRSSGLLLRDAPLAEAEAWAADHAEELASHEQEFLAACRDAQKAAERERRQSRRIRMLAVAAVVITVLAIGAAVFALSKTQEARDNAALASDNAAAAEARMAQMGQLISDFDIEVLASMASQLDAAGDRDGAATLLATAVRLNPASLDDADLKTLTADSLRLLKSLIPIGKNGAEYVFIPGGTFIMGSDATDRSAYGDEKPQRSIYLPSYWIGRTEVTNDQYAAFVDATGHPAPSHWDGGTVPAGKEDHPVVNVSWDDAVAYTVWLSDETGQDFRLPTEAEWEKACRGDSGRIYPWGDAFDASMLNLRGGGPGETTPVGSYSSIGGDSSYGLADMAGNVWEWTSSQFADYPYDGNDGRENLTDYGSLRVLRGGSFGNETSDVRCAVRYDYYPVYANVDGGFRVGWASPSASGF